MHLACGLSLKCRKLDSKMKVSLPLPFSQIWQENRLLFFPAQRGGKKGPHRSWQRISGYRRTCQEVLQILCSQGRTFEILRSYTHSLWLLRGYFFSLSRFLLVSKTVVLTSFCKSSIPKWHAELTVSSRKSEWCRCSALTARVRKVEVQPRSRQLKGLIHFVFSISQSWSGAESKACKDDALSSTRHQVGEDPPCGLQSCCKEELTSPYLPVSTGTSHWIRADSCRITGLELCWNSKELMSDPAHASCLKASWNKRFHVFLTLEFGIELNFTY